MGKFPYQFGSRYTPEQLLQALQANFRVAATKSDLDEVVAGTGFVTDAELAAELANYVSDSELTIALADYPTDSDLTTVLGGYTSDSDLTTALTNYPTQDEVDTALNSYLETAQAAVTYAPIASPTFTGDPKAPTPSSSDNDTSVATTAFVKSQKIHDLTAPTASTPMNSQKFTGLAAGTTNGDSVRYEQVVGVYQPLDSDLTTIAGLTATTDNFLQAKAGAWASRSVAQVVTDLVAGGLLASSTAASTYAPIASPTFTGDPKAPTPASTDSDTSIATTAFVKAQKLHDFTLPTAAVPMNSQKFTGLAAGSGAGDSLRYEQVVGVYAPLASPALTGTPTSTTAAVDTNTTQIATTAYVVGQGYLKSATAASTYQPLDSDLTTIAGLTATTDNFIQSKAGAWASRTVAQVVSDLTAGGLLPSATAAATYAPINSPTFTGTVTVGDVTGTAGTVNLTGSTAVTAPTVSIGAGNNVATIGAVNTALGAVAVDAYGAEETDARIESAVEEKADADHNHDAAYSPKEFSFAKDIAENLLESELMDIFLPDVSNFLKPRIKVGSFASSASGSRSITGVGFKPIAFITLTQQATSATVGSLGIGGADAAGNQFNVTIRADGTNGDRRARTTHCMGDNGAGAFVGGATFTSMDADGFTVNFDSATSVTVYYIAIGWGGNA